MAHDVGFGLGPGGGHCNGWRMKESWVCPIERLCNWAKAMVFTVDAPNPAVKRILSDSSGVGGSPFLHGTAAQQMLGLQAEFPTAPGVSHLSPHPNLS